MYSREETVVKGWGWPFSALSPLPPLITSKGGVEGVIEFPPRISISRRSSARDHTCIEVVIEAEVSKVNYFMPPTQSVY